MAGVPYEDEECGEEEETQTGIEGVIDDEVASSHAITAELKTADPRLSVEQEESAGHDAAPECRATVNEAEEQAETDDDFHTYAYTG